MNGMMSNGYSMDSVKLLSTSSCIDGKSRNMGGLSAILMPFFIEI
jgi:hypothetical protein